MTLQSRAATAKVSKRLSRSAEYRKPIEQNNDILDEVRNEKRNGTFRVVEDHSHVHVHHVSKKKRDHRNRYAIEPSRRYSTRAHSGKWEMSKADGRMMWSDTGSFYYDSKGDVVTVHNPDALNLEGPTLYREFRNDLQDPEHVDKR
jgi:hypothetical protein